MNFSILFSLKDGVSAGTRRIAEGIRGIGSAGAGLTQKMGDLGARLENTFGGLSASLSKLELGRQLKGSLVDPLTKAASEVERAKKGLEVNLPQTPQLGAQIGAFASAARATAGPTAFSEAQILDLQNEFVKSGLNVDAAIGAAEAAANLATAEASNGVDLGQAFRSINTLAAVFGMQGSEFGGGADLISRAAAAGQADPAKLSEALGGLTQAKSLGVDPRETLALFTTLGATMQGSEMGNAANEFLTTAASDKKLSKRLFDDKGQFSGWQEASKALGELTQGLNAQQRAAKFAKVFGRGPAADVANQLVGMDLGGVLTTMDQALPLAEKVVRMQETMTGQVDALGGSLDSLKAILGEPLLSPFRELAGRANDLVGQFSQAAVDDPRIAKGVAFGAAGVAGLGLLAGAMQVPGGLSETMRGLVGKGSALGGGVAKGKALETAGITPVYVVNAAEFGMGGPTVPGAGGPAAPGGGRLGMAAAAAPLVGAGLLAQAGVNEGVAGLLDGKKDGILKDYLQASAGQMILASPTRLLSAVGLGGVSDETLAQARAARAQGVDTLFGEKAGAKIKDLLGLNVTVNVDAAGQATVTAGWDGGGQAEVASARSGAL